jgi:FKBP-type peptidyl-prolyl cis-trans isomerase 2
MGDRLSEMERLYGADLPPGARIERAAKSAVIRARVEPIDMTQVAFDSCEVAVGKSIEVAVSLLDWYTKKHRSEVTQFSLGGGALEALEPRPDAGAPAPKL